MKKQFGDRLKELRLEKELTQEELAKSFCTGKASISHYESNRRLPDANTIEKFADYFNVSVDYILGRTNTRNEVSSDEDIELIQRAHNKMDPKQKEKMMRLLKLSFEDLFSEEDN